MPNKILVRSCYVAAFALSLVFSSTAHAGFEWVSPNDGGPSQPPPSTGSYAPPATTMPEIISPVIISGDSRSAPQASSYAPAPSYPTPSYPAPAPSYPAPSAMAPAAQPAPAAATYVPQQPNNRPNLATATIATSPSSGDVVQGFATQIPLPLALRQILPAGYNFSIDQDIDMNALVSYRGGKSWRETLHDMLSSVGLVGHEQGSTLTVSHMAAAAAPVPAPAPYLPPLPEKSIGQLTLVSSAPTRVDAPQANVEASDGWSVERGDTLRKALTGWCQRAGVELQWVAEYDYPVEASVHFNGSFEDAVRGLLAGFDGARPQPVGELHTNATAGQMVLVVQVRGNNYSN